ncbi:hypothetical protein P5673_012992 [Acropora cervicornis]|uniref:Uncharacterized protein n=1 Tax=Acropora cervicornis TaxID=6130 RepID=A0AAD9V7C3_ACRCE|nr:hypothetical protein P5673_012992 [Acropora cervicornis]
MSGLELANRLYNFFVSVKSDVPALDYLTLPAFLPAPDELPSTKKLLRLICSPDAILKLFAFELSEPVTTIFNQSLSSTDFPSAWRDVHISPIPKTSPVACDSNLPPVLDDFVVQWHMEYIKEHIDPNQFGSVKDCDYETALCKGSIPSLSERRLCLCNKTFEKACESSSCLFSSVFPPGRNAAYVT